MEVAFLDESGDDLPFGGTPYLVVSLLITGQPRLLALAVRRSRRRYDAGLASGEMKADATPPDVTARLLRAIVETPVEIVAVILDKSAIVRPPSDPHAIYRFVVAEAVRRTAERWPQLDLRLDKRYTAPKLRELLEQAIRDRLAGLTANVVIRQEDSIADKGLQAVDFVAWAFYQKYARGNCEFYDIVAPRVVVEEQLRIALWE